MKSDHSEHDEPGHNPKEKQIDHGDRILSPLLLYICKRIVHH